MGIASAGILRAQNAVMVMDGMQPVGLNAADLAALTSLSATPLLGKCASVFLCFIAVIKEDEGYTISHASAMERQSQIALPHSCS